MSDDPVLYEQDGRVATITINRPDKRNVLDRAAGEALTQALARFQEGDARVGILTGAGGKAFTAGIDLNDPPEPWRFLPGAGLDIDKPLIAAVSGWCAGGGIPLVMMCDLAVATEGARFLYPEAKVGFTGGLVASLAARIPHKAAMEMLFLGEPLGAERAREACLVNAVVAEGEHLDKAREWAATLEGYAPLVLRTLKRMIAQTLPAGPVEQAARTWSELDAVAGSRDAEEGRRAFYEKRPPDFEGE